MTTIYKHEAPKTNRYDTRRIVVERLYDGSTDITIIVGECGNAVFTNHNLSIAESDRFGAAICKDIIDNYTRHAANLNDKITDLENVVRDMQYSNNDLLNENTALRIARISSDDKRDEYRKTIVAERIDHMAEKRAINQTHHGAHRRNGCIIEELAKTNAALKHDLCEHQKRWDRFVIR